MNYWLIFGFVGQILFGARFFVQWISSERKKESHIPIVFWYLSLSGGAILLIYAIHLHEPVFIVGQSTGVLIYLRNLRLIYKKQKAERMAVSQKIPPDPVQVVTSVNS